MTDIILSYKSDTQLEGATATLERLELTLMTDVGSISSDPEFGFNMAGIIDEQLTPEIIYKIKGDLLNLLTNHFPELVLLGIKVEKKGLSTIEIELHVRVLTSDTVSNIKIDYTND